MQISRGALCVRAENQSYRSLAPDLLLVCASECEQNYFPSAVAQSLRGKQKDLYQREEPISTLCIFSSW